jgi:hypothetical protein
MTKRFCDLCEKEMSPEDDKPFVRVMNNVVVSLMVTNEHLHAINDICHDCKVKVVNNGKPFPDKESLPIATLQPSEGAFRPPVPPQIHPFEPSQSATQPT